MEKLECEGRGSYPAPKFKWYVGKRELEGTIQTDESYVAGNDNFVTGSFAQEERKESQTVTTDKSKETTL